MDILRTRIFTGLVATLTAWVVPGIVSAANYIDMGPGPLLGALDQPFVRIELSDAGTALGPSTSTNQFLLDTGATSILAVAGAAADLRRSSGDFTQGEFLEQGVGGFIPYQVSAPYTVNVLGSGRATLAAGDANEDLSFDQLDIVQVLQRGKYLTGQFADWGGGDWAQATDGYPGSPAEGDGRFDQLDIVAALQYGLYNRGPYATQTDGVGGISNVDVRILSDPAQSFGDGLAGFEGIVGMPAMVRRVTTLDMDSAGSGDGLSNIDLNDLDALIDLLSGSSVASGIGVSFSHAMPASNGHRYGIPVRALHFDPDEPGPVPTAAPLPVVTANHHLDGRTVTGDSYIIDTGAQMSFMSLDKARSLGLDPNDPFTSLPIAGVGGTKDVPVFYIESLSLTTNEGVELFWRDVQVIGLDLDPSIDGVIGSDLLTAGMLETSLGAIDLDNLLTVGEGPIEKVHFDFRTLDQDTKDGTGAMYLDLNPDYDLVQDGVFDPNAGGGGGGDDPLAGLDLSGLGLSGLDLAGLDLTNLDLTNLDDLDIFDLISDIFGMTAIPGHQAAGYLGSSPDTNAEGSIYEATFGSGFDLLELGEVTPAGLDQTARLSDPLVAGSLAAGAALDGLELVHVPVPEPSSLILLLLGTAGWFALRRRRRN